MDLFLEEEKRLQAMEVGQLDTTMARLSEAGCMEAPWMTPTVGTRNYTPG